MIKVIYASGADSDLFYVLKSRIPDNFFYFDVNGAQHIFLDQREIGAFKKHQRDSKVNVHGLEEASALAAKERVSPNDLYNLAWWLWKKFKLVKQKVLVPNSFPLDLIDFLRSQGALVEPLQPFYDRTLKSEAEAKIISKNLAGLYPAYDLVKEVLKKSKIKNNNVLEYRGQILTSEILKKAVEHVFVDQELIDVEGMIISSGRDASMPHHRGHGIIKAHQPIICDFFPKHKSNGYFCDMTRTFVKGRPSVKLEKIYYAVLEAQTKAIKAIKPGMLGHEVHNICVETFLSKGFHVGLKGFVHGTGHGLGIDIHEAPYINAKSQTIIKGGQIFTVEPGLYYPEIGGVRIEDVIFVTPTGSRNLTKYPKEFIV